MNKIKVLSMIPTSYEDDTWWLEYEVNNKIGYFILNDTGSVETMQKVVDDLTSKAGFIDKPNLKECTPYLESIILDCLQSENEMWFVENDDEEYRKLVAENPNFCDELKEEVKRLNVDDYVRFGEDEAAITVYGGVITKFLF